MSSLIIEVVTIDAIHAIEKADRLVSAQVKGWFCVVAKDSFQVGDKAVYIPIDSVLSGTTLETLFPVDSKIRPTNGRIRTIKIRGAISQGMLARLDALGLPANLPVGTDVSQVIHISKYEPPVDQSGPCKQGAPASKKNTNPNFKKYTGIENYKNYPGVFEEGEDVCITEKIHGTNFRCGWVPAVTDTWWKKIKKLFGRLPAYEFVYGSHNVQLTNKFIYDGFYSDQGNVYADAVKKYKLKELLKPGEVLYGEVYGDGIQKNYKYGCAAGEHKLVVFDLMVNGAYVNQSTAMYWCDCRGLEHVPVLWCGPFSLEGAKKLTEGNSVLCPAQKVREGVVIKPMVESVHPRCGRKVLKLIADAYLLDKNNTDNH